MVEIHEEQSVNRSVAMKDETDRPAADYPRLPEPLPRELVPLAIERACRRMSEETTPIGDQGDYISREIQQAAIDHAAGSFP
jgi:hypothetical protein